MISWVGRSAVQLFSVRAVCPDNLLLRSGGGCAKSGAAAAICARHVSKRYSWFGAMARRAPYLSSALIILVGLYVGYQGWAGLAGQKVKYFRGSPLPKTCENVS